MCLSCLQLHTKNACWYSCSTVYTLQRRPCYTSLLFWRVIFDWTMSSSSSLSCSGSNSFTSATSRFNAYSATTLKSQVAESHDQWYRMQPDSGWKTLKQRQWYMLDSSLTWKHCLMCNYSMTCELCLSSHMHHDCICSMRMTSCCSLRVPVHTLVSYAPCKLVTACSSTSKHIQPDNTQQYLGAQTCFWWAANFTD